jgi:hypothetical protein
VQTTHHTCECVCVRQTHLDEHAAVQMAVGNGVQRCGSKSSMRLAG